MDIESRVSVARVVRPHTSEQLSVLADHPVENTGTR